MNIADYKLSIGPVDLNTSQLGEKSITLCRISLTTAKKFSDQ